MLLVEEREVCLKLMRSGAEFAYFGEFVAAGGLHLHDLSPQERSLSIVVGMRRTQERGMRE